MLERVDWTVVVSIPAQVVTERFNDWGGTMTGIHGCVVLEAVLTNDLHQLLKAWNLGDCTRTEGIERVVGE
jgi:hypothetical protein